MSQIVYTDLRFIGEREWIAFAWQGGDPKGENMDNEKAQLPRDEKKPDPATPPADDKTTKQDPSEQPS